MATEGEEDEACKTFVLNKEDHTLGNSLRYVIMKKYVLNVTPSCLFVSIMLFKYLNTIIPLLVTMRSRHIWL